MITYLAPVTLLLDHGMATNNTVKVEFHFDSDLPPAETVSGNIGPIQCTIRARMPERPLRSGSMKNVASMRYPASYTTLTSCSPASAAPASGRRWHLLLVRYAHEYEIWTIDIAARAPDAGIRDRLQRWASYNVAHPDPGGRSARYSNRNCASRFAASRGAGVPAACGSRLPSSASTPKMTGPSGSRPSPQRHSYQAAKPSGSRTLSRSWRMRTHDRFRSNAPGNRTEDITIRGMFPLRPIEGHVRRNPTTKPIPSLAAAPLHAK